MYAACPSHCPWFEDTGYEPPRYVTLPIILLSLRKQFCCSHAFLSCHLNMFFSYPKFVKNLLPNHVTQFVGKGVVNPWPTLSLSSMQTYVFRIAQQNCLS